MSILAYLFYLLFGKEPQHRTELSIKQASREKPITAKHKAPQRHNRVSRDKHIVVKHQGREKQYHINKYGEVFEER